MGLMQGSGVGLAWEGEIMAVAVAKGRLRIRGLPRVRVGLGHRLTYRRSSQSSDRGIWWGLGH